MTRPLRTRPARKRAWHAAIACVVFPSPMSSARRRRPCSSRRATPSRWYGSGGTLALLVDDAARGGRHLEPRLGSFEFLQQGLELRLDLFPARAARFHSTREGSAPRWWPGEAVPVHSPRHEDRDRLGLVLEVDRKVVERREPIEGLREGEQALHELFVEGVKARGHAERLRRLLYQTQSRCTRPRVDAAALELLSTPARAGLVATGHRRQVARRGRAERLSSYSPGPVPRAVCHTASTSSVASRAR